MLAPFKARHKATQIPEAPNEFSRILEGAPDSYYKNSHTLFGHTTVSSPPGRTDVGRYLKSVGSSYFLFFSVLFFRFLGTGFFFFFFLRAMSLLLPAEYGFM
jgi:hypothetical protein